MDHLRTKMNANRANDPDPKSIAQNPKRDYEANQKSSSPSAGQEQIGCDQTGQNEHQAGANSAAFLTDLNRDVRQLKDRSFPQDGGTGHIEKQIRSFGRSK